MRHLPLLALFLAAPAAAQLSPAEQRLKPAIAAGTARDEALLQRLVEQNSGSLNIAGVTKAADMLRPEFEQLGFTVRWADMKAADRAGHLIATRAGNGRGKRVLLIGHLDTVFEPDSAFRGFTRRGDGTATGPGILDDKGGIVVILAALRAMKAASTLDGADVTVVLTGDEERTGAPLSVARADLIAAGKRADAALEFENLVIADGKEQGTVARRGSTSWEVVATGVTGHSSTVFGPALGYGAIYEAARIADAFRRELPEPNLTYNIGLIAGGTPVALEAEGTRAIASGKPNIVAERAVMRGDLRALTPDQVARVRAKMTAIVARHLPKTGATITFNDSYPPMAPSERNRALLAKMNVASRDLGLPEMPEYDPSKRGAADSAFVAADVATMGGMGPAGGGAHAEGEWIDLSTIPRQALRAAVLIGRLSSEDRTAGK